VSKHIIEKLLDWECRTANEESEILMEAVSYIDLLKNQNAKLAGAILSAHKNIAAGSGLIVDDDVECDCSACQLAREIMGGGE